MLDPSLMTVALTARTLSAERRAGMELEHRPGDLHVVAGLEARGLQLADHADRAQALLDVGERLVVVDVVASEEPLDPRARHPEDAVAAALDLEALVGRRPVKPVLGERLPWRRRRLGRHVPHQRLLQLVHPLP